MRLRMGTMSPGKIGTEEGRPGRGALIRTVRLGQIGRLAQARQHAPKRRPAPLPRSPHRGVASAVPSQEVPTPRRWRSTFQGSFAR